MSDVSIYRHLEDAGERCDRFGFILDVDTDIKFHTVLHEHIIAGAAYSDMWESVQHEFPDTSDDLLEVMFTETLIFVTTELLIDIRKLNLPTWPDHIVEDAGVRLDGEDTVCL